MELTAKFKMERETKNKLVFVEIVLDGQEAIVGSLYVSKSAFDDEVPTKLLVTIREIKKKAK